MANLLDLPTELVLQIIGHLVVYNTNTPAVGRNAAWTTVESFMENQFSQEDPVWQDVGNLDEEEGGEEPQDLSVRSESPVGALPSALNEIRTQDVEEFATVCAAYEAYLDEEEEEKPVPCLKKLRLVNRYLNDLCLPIVLQHLNLLFAWIPLRLQPIQEQLIRPHGAHIHTLRTYLDGHLSPYGARDKLGVAIVAILQELKNLRSLGLYFYYGGGDTTQILKETRNLLENGVLEEVGVYSMTVLSATSPLEHLQWQSVDGIMQYLQGIATSPASHKLKKLDIVTEQMDKETYDILVHSDAFASLRQLTVRHSFRRNIWEENPTKRLLWAAKSKLTRLQLINCQTAYAPDIPPIIQNFEALSELVISTCGWREDPIPPPRESSWSQRKDALWRTMKPLKWFKLEHMIDWEIEALGVIPATEVWVVNGQSRSLFDALQHDPDLFPGMKILRQRPRWDQDSQMRQTGAKGSLVDRLKKMAEAREVELRDDAERMMICACCAWLFNPRSPFGFNFF